MKPMIAILALGPRLFPGASRSTAGVDTMSGRPIFPALITIRQTDMEFGPRARRKPPRGRRSGPAMRPSTAIGFGFLATEAADGVFISVSAAPLCGALREPRPHVPQHRSERPSPSPPPSNSPR